jgi:hypothetical protein
MVMGSQDGRLEASSTLQLLQDSEEKQTEYSFSKRF